MTDRLAIAMWDFSWLLRRQAPEDEYANWERSLDELVERGYNCVRIDAFPHLISTDFNGRQQDRFIMLPQKPSFPWGNHRKVEVNPREGLIQFLSLARERGIRVGLSSWFTDDTTHRRDHILNPIDYRLVWRDTLDCINRAGLIDTIEWVDVCNEFPLGQWAPQTYRRLFKRRWPNLAPLFYREREDRRKLISDYFEHNINLLNRDYPQLKFTFSFQPMGFKHITAIDVSYFDMAEIHCWLGLCSEFNRKSRHLFGLIGAPGGLAWHRHVAPALYARHREHWLAQLSERMDEWVAWARKNGLDLYTSEGWGPVNYIDSPHSEDASEWDWVKDVNKTAVRMAVEKGWVGICSSNFCQPHFPGMWKDIAWHREVTQMIRA